MKHKKESVAISKLKKLLADKEHLNLHWKFQKEKDSPHKLIISKPLDQKEAKEYAKELNELFNTKQVKIRPSSSHTHQYRVVIPITLLSPKLNKDILGLIFKELGTKELGRVSQVSKEFKEDTRKLLSERKEKEQAKLGATIKKALDNLNEQGTKYEYSAIEPIKGDPEHFMVTRAATRINPYAPKESYKISSSELKEYAEQQDQPLTPKKA